MFDQSVIRQFEIHAQACFPDEACGLIVDGKFVPVENTADNPRIDFHIDGDVQMRIREAGGKIEAVLHSHTPHDVERVQENADGTETLVIEQELLTYPTVQDQIHQRQSAIPWGITVLTDGNEVSETFFFGDQVPILPLLGRPFKHAVWDCYTLIRDFYRQKGIILIEKPRQNDWWELGDDVYKDWAEAGFFQIDAKEVRSGDCFLMKVRSPVVNHGGVYLGNDLIMHHLMHRLSNTDVANRWASRVDIWLRHESMKGN